jgi:outer membrane receptor protein involved in Fe transport
MRGTQDTETLQRRLFHVLAGAPADRPLELTLNDIAAGSGSLTLQADYFRPLRGGRLDIGYRAWQRSNDNDNLLRVFETMDAPDPRERRHSGYEFEEVFHSLYSTYALTKGRFGVNVGLRAELADTRFASAVTGDAFEREYNTLFPSVNLSYSPVQGRTFRLLYSKRIARPPAFYLDPYVPATDPLNRSIGNPDLRPSYTQSFSADLNVTGGRGTFRIGPYYRRSTDVWERIRTVDTAGVATSRWENGRSAEAYGSTFTVSLRPQGRVSGSTTLSVYRDVRDGTNISSAYRRSATLWSVGGNVGLKLRESLTAQMFGNHFPMQSILQGRASGYTFMSLALRQQLWGTKGSISLNISDPFNLYSYTSTSTDATYIQTSRSSYRSRVATLGLTYNFGRPPQQQSRRTAGGEETGETIRVR